MRFFGFYLFETELEGGTNFFLDLKIGSMCELENGTNFWIGLKMEPIFAWDWNSDQFSNMLETRANSIRIETGTIFGAWNMDHFLTGLETGTNFWASYSPGHDLTQLKCYRKIELLEVRIPNFFGFLDEFLNRGADDRCQKTNFCQKTIFEFLSRGGNEMNCAGKRYQIYEMHDWVLDSVSSLGYHIGISARVSGGFGQGHSWTWKFPLTSQKKSPNS